jgi:acetyl-CoA synthetase
MTTDQVAVHQVPARLLDASKNPVPHVNSLEQYRAMWKESTENPDQFFGDVSIYINKLESSVFIFILACS